MSDKVKSRPTPERAAMPLASLIAFVGMLVVAATVSFRFLRLAVETPGDQPVGVRIGVTVAAIIMFAALPVFSMRAIYSSWRSAPVLVTIVGALSAPQIFGFLEPIGVVSGLAGISAVIAVWLPSAVRHRRDAQARSRAR